MRLLPWGSSSPTDSERPKHRPCLEDVWVNIWAEMAAAGTVSRAGERRKWPSLPEPQLIDFYKHPGRQPRKTPELSKRISHSTVSERRPRGHRTQEGGEGSGSRPSKFNTQRLLGRADKK